MTFGTLLENLQTLTSEFGVRWDAPVLPTRHNTIGQALHKWCAVTRCMYRANINFTTNGDPGPFSVDDKNSFSLGAVPVAMVEVDHLFINGVYVPPIGLADAAVNRYLDTGSVVPFAHAWYKIGETQFQILPAPGTTEVTGKVHGPIQHPAVSSENWDGDNNIQLPEEMQLDFQMYCLEWILRGSPIGDQGDYMRELKRENAQTMDAIRRQMLSHPSIVERDTESTIVSLTKRYRL